MWIGWKRFVAVVLPIEGVLMGVPGWLEPVVEICLKLGKTILIREGEGEGAREETLLEAVEPETSQVWSRSKSSSVVGPPSVLSEGRGNIGFQLL